MQMLDKMEETGMTQKQLAQKMGCSQQYVSKILKGKENLSLETLSKIEYSLEISIFQLVQRYNVSQKTCTYMIGIKYVRVYQK